MKFFSFIALAFVSVAAASPVAHQPEKRLDLSSITKLLDSGISEAVAGNSSTPNSRATAVDAIVGDLKTLLSTLILDVENVASAAGIDISSLLSEASVTGANKRAVPYVVEENRVNAIVSAVTKLLVDLLGNIIKVAEDAGISLGSGLLSALGI